MKNAFLKWRPSKIKLQIFFFGALIFWKMSKGDPGVVQSKKLQQNTRSIAQLRVPAKPWIEINYASVLQCRQ